MVKAYIDFPYKYGDILYLLTEKQHIMTELGLYLAKKSINRAEVSRKTGISAPRMTELALNPKAHLRAKELYLIALAIDVNPCELLKVVCEKIALKEQQS